MKILVASDQWSPDVLGGSARVAAGAARALVQRGHEVVALTMAAPSLPEVSDESGVEVRRVLRRSGLPQSVADPVVTFKHARALRRRSFDVLLAHQATNACGLSAARLGVPLAFAFHASVVLEMRFLRKRVTGTRRAALYALAPLLSALEHAALRRADRVLVLSEFSKELVRRRHAAGSSRVRVVGGAVEDVFFSNHPDPQACRARFDIPPGTFLFTARRLEPRMGLDLLIEALARLGDRELVLGIAGSGSASQHLQRQISSLGLDDRVRLLGAVSDDDLRGLYAAADLFLLPTIAYEGFGMSTVEALATGTPVLGTAIGATPEILEGLGPEFLAPRADADELARAIRNLLPLLGPGTRARARQLAEDRYRWERAVLPWEQALLDISDR